MKAIDGGAGLKEGRSGKTLLRIRITAEVDGVKSDYWGAPGLWLMRVEAALVAARRWGVGA